MAPLAATGGGGESGIGGSQGPSLRPRPAHPADRPAIASSAAPASREEWKRSTIRMRMSVAAQSRVVRYSSIWSVVEIALEFIS